MALYHRATVTPSKSDLIKRWLPTQEWMRSGGDRFEVLGSFRFDDPEGRVGMESHLVQWDDELLHVPLTYRDGPLPGGDQGFVGNMDHSALGRRWIYDGVHDPVFLRMLVAVAMTGQGEALGMVEVDGRWLIAPSQVRIEGGGWTQGRVAVDGFELAGENDGNLTLRSDSLELTFLRRPQRRPRPTMGLAARLPGQTEPVLLATVRALPPSQS